MLILGIESATAQVGVALGSDEGVLASAHSARDRRHAENLTPQIQFVTQQARVELTKVSCIAVDVGPGMFTGLRVGLASAMALAHGLGVPMIGISSLDIGAATVENSSRTVTVCYDARRGEVFSAKYRRDPAGEMASVSDPRVSTPDDLAADLADSSDEILMVGDGVERYREAFSGFAHIQFARAGLMYPSARTLVELAYPKAMREEFVSPNEIEPMYLRLPDAEINWKTRDGR